MRSRMWNHFSCATAAGMQRYMKIMGTLRLASAAGERSTDGTARALGALCAELIDASWKSVEDVRAAYPNALVDGANVTIVVGPQCIVRLVVNYSTSIILIVGVDSVARTEQRSARGRGKAN